jgi:hypothetical protein
MGSEQDEALTAFAGELMKEAKSVAAIANGFEEVPLLPSLQYASHVFNQYALPDTRKPGEVPIDLQVAARVLEQAIRVLKRAPSAASLTEQSASDFERSQPHRPATTVELDPPEGPSI